MERGRMGRGVRRWGELEAAYAGLTLPGGGFALEADAGKGVKTEGEGAVAGFFRRR